MPFLPSETAVRIDHFLWLNPDFQVMHRNWLLPIALVALTLGNQTIGAPPMPPPNDSFPQDSHSNTEQDRLRLVAGGSTAPRTGEVARSTILSKFDDPVGGGRSSNQEVVITDAPQGRSYPPEVARTESTTEVPARQASLQIPDPAAAAAGPLASKSPPPVIRPAAPEYPLGNVPLELETALEWTLQYNPTLIATRQNLSVSEAALDVARRFPTSLNPSVSLQVQPWTYEHVPHGLAQPLETLFNITWSQPIELGHRTSLRESVWRASYNQTQWSIVQAELTALVETYRLHQTAVYRAKRLQIADRLAALNRRLVESLERQVEANQATAADLVLAQVESQTTVEQLIVARRETMIAITKLRQQLGMPEYAASVEPSGALVLPQFDLAAGEDTLVQTALACRPEVRSAEAQAAGSRAAVSLARADQIPIFSIGPSYEKDETGTTFLGVSASSPVPILNAGRPLVRQREAEHYRDCVAIEQTRRRVIADVKAAIAQWKEAQESVVRSTERMRPLAEQTARMEHLYQAGQTNVVTLLIVRQRTIEAENAQLDALWQSTQAYADLLVVMGASPLIASRFK